MQDQFEQDYTAVRRLAMVTNYRSTPSIVAHSNALIAYNYQNPSRGSCSPKPLQAAPGTESARGVQFVRYRSKESQGEHILNCVRWWHEQGEHHLLSLYLAATLCQHYCYCCIDWQAEGGICIAKGWYLRLLVCRAP